MGSYFDELKADEFTEIQLELIDLIGFDAFEVLVDKFGGTNIYFPTISACVYHTRRRRFIEDYGKLTTNKSELSRIYGYNPKAGMRILNGYTTVPPLGDVYVKSPSDPLYLLSFNDLTEQQKAVAEIVGFDVYIETIKTLEGLRFRVPDKRWLEKKVINRKIAKAYNDSLLKIADQFGITVQEVKNVIHYVDITGKAIKHSRRNKQIVEDFNQGITRHDIAEKYGLSKSQICKIINWEIQRSKLKQKRQGE